jgi:ABC-type Fe3+-hydroxamate transport system substrate-binding protein
MNRFQISSAILMAVGLAACGCSSSVGKVTGNVKMNGQPLADAQVSFLPKVAKGGSANVAITDASGNFEVKPNPTTKVTLKPGQYSVLVGKFVDIKTGQALKQDEDFGQLLAQGKVYDVVPEVYRDHGKTPLNVEIKTGDNALQPFELKSP